MLVDIQLMVLYNTSAVAEGSRVRCAFNRARVQPELIYNNLRTVTTPSIIISRNSSPVLPALSAKSSWSVPGSFQMFRLILLSCLPFCCFFFTASLPARDVVLAREMGNITEVHSCKGGRKKILRITSISHHTDTRTRWVLQGALNDPETTEQHPKGPS